MRAVAGALPSLALLPGSLAAQEHAVAFRGARILPVAGPAIESGVLVIQGGRIVYCADPHQYTSHVCATVIEGQVVSEGCR